MLHVHGNHIAKLASSIYDTPVLDSVKVALRYNKPILLGISTKDGLSTNAENIGKLLNSKNIFFIPFTHGRMVYTEKYKRGLNA